MNKLIKTIPAIMLSLFMSFSVLAVEPVYTALFSDKAIKGYDTVAYFTQNKAVKGQDQYSYQYQGATWLFSSADNRQLFIDAPTTYAPQFGGYCAYAVSQNSTAAIKPELFTIVQGKLYLNYNKAINTKWLADTENYIKQAEQHWPKLLAK